MFGCGAMLKRHDLQICCVFIPYIVFIKYITCIVFINYITVYLFHTFSLSTISLCVFISYILFIKYFTVFISCILFLSTTGISLCIYFIHSFYQLYHCVYLFHTFFISTISLCIFSYILIINYITMHLFHTLFFSCSSKNTSFCPSVCLSHLFHYVPIIVSSLNFQELLPLTKVMSMQEVKVRGQRSRSQRSWPH